MTEWQDISTVPKNGEDYLFTNGIDCAVGCFNPCYISYDTSLINPTHWMPLPKRPVKKHICEKSGYYCTNNQDGMRFGKKGHSFIYVDFCPFCGQKA